MLENLFFTSIPAYYLRVYLDTSAFKIANKQMTDHLDDNNFEV